MIKILIFSFEIIFVFLIFNLHVLHKICLITVVTVIRFNEVILQLLGRFWPRPFSCTCRLSNFEVLNPFFRFKSHCENCFRNLKRNSKNKHLRYLNYLRLIRRYERQNKFCLPEKIYIVYCTELKIDSFRNIFFRIHLSL